MSKRVRFLISVILLSPVVFLLWGAFIRAHYFALIRETVSAVWREAEPANVSVPTSVDNLVPFLVLMFATPSVPIRKRIRGLAYGIGVLLVAHILVAAFTTKWLSDPAPSQLYFFLSLLSSTVMVALPFLVWLVLSWEEMRALVVAAPGPTSK